MMLSNSLNEKETTSGATKNPGLELRKRLGTRLFNLALAWSSAGGRPDTKVAQRLAIRGLKGRKQTGAVSSIEKSLAEVQAASLAIEHLRDARDQYKRHASACRSTRQIVRISGVPAAERVREWSKKRIVETLKASDPMRGSDAPAGCRRKTVLTDDRAAVRYNCETWGDWNVYRGAFKGWRANGVAKTVTIPTDWYDVVHRVGLTVLDGKLTLDARQVESSCDGMQAYAAVWAEQGRGYAVHTVCGFICTKGGAFAHGASLREAEKRVMRKEKARVRVEERDSL